MLKYPLRSITALLIILIFVSNCEETDTTPPEVALTYPTNEAFVSEIVTITCEASDNEGIERVELFIDGIASDSIDDTSPYSFIWNTTEYEDGSSHTIAIRAVDVNDNMSDSEPVIVTVDQKDSYPLAVKVININYDTNAMVISWEESPDSDFDRYELFNGSDTTTTDLLAVIDKQDSLSYSMTEFNPLVDNYFRVTVYDTLGLSKSGRYLSNDLHIEPNSVDITDVSYTFSEMSIFWELYVPDLARIQTMNALEKGMNFIGETDFVSYELLYSTSEFSEKTLIATIVDVDLTSYSLTDFDPTHENWFWVKVNDFWGLSSIGSGLTHTVDDKPTPIDVLFVDYNLDEMTIGWSRSTDTDFNSYELMYSTSENGVKTSIATIVDVDSTGYMLTNFDPTLENWFWVNVTDFWGQASYGSGLSNTIETPPAAIDVVSVTYDPSEMVVTWEQSEADDFRAYELFYSENESGAQSSVAVFEDINTTFVTISDFDPTHENWFWVKVTDYWRLVSTGAGLSNTLDAAPTAAFIYPNEMSDGAITIRWTENRDDDFTSYKLYESLHNNMNNSTLIYSSTSAVDTTYLISNLDPDQIYFYRLETNDFWNQQSESNVEVVAIGASLIKTFGGPENDWGTSVQMTMDGGYIMTGYTRSFGNGPATPDLWLVKTDANGNEEWNQTYGGNDTDYGYSVQETSDGGYIMTGYTKSFGNGSADLWLIKTDVNGNQIWDQTFGGTGDDFGLSVQATTDGNYIITGYTESFGNGLDDVWLIKTDINGNEIWSQTFGGANFDRGLSVQEIPGSGFIIVGNTGWSQDGSDDDIWLIKTDTNGNEEWNQLFGDSGDDIGRSVQVTSDGGYILVGSLGPSGNGNSGAWLIKTDVNGNQIWNQTFGGSNGSGQSVQETTDGGYILTGYTLSYGNGLADVWLTKTDINGNEIWSQTFGGSENDYGLSVQEGIGDTYIIAGSTWSYGSGSADIWLIKTR